MCRRREAFLSNYLSPRHCRKKNQTHRRGRQAGERLGTQPKHHKDTFVGRMDPVAYHYGRMASLDLDRMPKGSRQLLAHQRTNTAKATSETETRTRTSSRTSKTDRPVPHQPSSYLLALDHTWRQGRRNGSRGRASTAATARKRSRSSVAVAGGVAAVANVLVLSTLLCLLCLSCLAAPAVGLVIEEPFYGTFDHV